MGQQNYRIEGLDMLLSAYLPDRIKKAVKGIKNNYVNEMEKIRFRSDLPHKKVFSWAHYLIGEE